MREKRKGETLLHSIGLGVIWTQNNPRLTCHIKPTERQRQSELVGNGKYSRDWLGQWEKPLVDNITSKGGCRQQKRKRARERETARFSCRV